MNDPQERTPVGESWSSIQSWLFPIHGGRHVRVRGPTKVAAHPAFGLVVIAAEQMLKLLA